MAIANPRVHIICGICGNNKSMSYRIHEELNDDADKLISVVSLTCGNCNSLTDLDELMPEKNVKESNR